MKKDIMLNYAQQEILNLLIEQANINKKISVFWGGRATGKTFLLKLVEEEMKNRAATAVTPPPVR